MFYVTKDFDGYNIEEDAFIAAFETRDEAEAYLKEPYAIFEDGEAVEIVAGDFADCWIKAADTALVEITPFSQDQVATQTPGTHPGGNVHWMTPREPVLVAKVS